MIKDTYGGTIPLFNTRIPRSIKVAEACMYRQTICEFLPDNPAAVAYEKFVEELMELAGQ